MRVALPRSPSRPTAGRIVASPLEPRPALVTAAWEEARLHADLPAGCQLVIEGRERGRSRRGWPVTVFSCAVCAADGAVVEHRLVVLYDFVGHAGTAELRTLTSPAAVDPALIALVLDAAPDFSGAVACLADLFDD